MPTRQRKGRKSRKSRAVSLYQNVPKNSPMPMRYLTKLRWSGRVELNGGFTQSAVRVFSANGIAIPDALQPSIQPRGFDQLMPLYDHYTVLGSKITFDYANSDNSNQQLITMTVQDNFNVQTDAREYMERGYGSTHRIAGTQNSGTGTGRLSLKCNPQKFLGLDNVLNEKDAQGSAITNPIEAVYYHLSVSDVNGNEDPDPIQGWVTIDYIVMFQEPRFVGAS